MARTFTVAQQVDLIRKIGELEVLDGDYASDAPSAPSSGTLIGLMDRAHAHAWEIWSAADEGWNSRRTALSPSPGSGSFFDLPADCHRIRAVQFMFGGPGVGWETLRRANAQDDVLTAPLVGYPEAYREFPTQLEILPVGSSADLRITYTPVAPTLSSLDQTMPGTDGFDLLVVYLTLIMVREREDKDTSGFRSRALEVEARFRESCRRRDRAQAMRMRPRDGSLRYPNRRRDVG